MWTLMQLTAWHKHKRLNYIAKMAIVYGIMLPGYLMQHEWLLTEVSVSVERVSCYVRTCDSSGQNCSSIPHFPLLVGHTTKHVEELLVISLEVQMPFHSCTWAKNLDGINIIYGTQHHWYHIWSYICMLLVWLKAAAAQNQ